VGCFADEGLTKWFAELELLSPLVAKYRGSMVYDLYTVKRNEFDQLGVGDVSQWLGLLRFGSFALRGLFLLASSGMWAITYLRLFLPFS